MNYRNLLFVFLLLSSGLMARSQDTLASLRLFIDVCNNYKALPVRMDLDIQHSSNLVVAAADTAVTHASFSLRTEGSYVAYGELEQLANDSLILLVSNKLKRMIAYRNTQSVSSRLRDYIGWQMKDSSITRLAAKYTVVQEPGKKDTARITLKSRQLVKGAGLPAEELQISYNRGTQDPYIVRQLTRSLLPVDSTIEQRMLPSVESVTLADGSHRLVREQVVVFAYKNITHRPEDHLPVVIADRVALVAPGKYQPAKAYAGYTLTQQF